MKKNAILPLVMLCVAACSGPREAPEPAPSASAAALPAAGRDDAQRTARPGTAPRTAAVPRYAGRWTGVEGMYLVVTARPAGGVSLEMRHDLDHKGTYAGTATAAGIRFVRDGVVETLVPGDGAATGLKWLAGKKDCLTVKPGEGYCRG